MAPKAKLSASERSAKLTQRGAALAKKADFTISVGILRRYPDSSRDVRKLLRDLGHIDANGEIACDMPHGARTGSSHDDGQRAAGSTPGKRDFEPDIPIQPGWQSIGDIPGDTLEALLGFMEPVSCRSML